MMDQTSMTEDEMIKKDYSGWDEKFWDVQAKGLCGEHQNNGKRCTNKVTEFFNLDPDRPGAVVVGACGVHVKDVGPRVANQVSSRGDRNFEKWEEAETYRIARAFRAMGFDLKFEPGYRGRGSKFIVNNPGQFIATLDRLGVVEQLGLDLNTEQCGAQNPTSTYKICREAKGHYPETEHSDWAHSHWKDPEPVVPEPEPEVNEVKTVSSDGGSFT